MIPDEVVEQVSQQADIVAIISEYVRLKKVGSVWRGPCPFHQGTNANFSVQPRGGYTCFVCGEKGSVFTFVQKRLGMSFVEAVKYVGAKSGIEVTEVDRKREGPDPREPMWELQATVAEFFQRTLWDEPAGAHAREYLASRAVSRATAERFGIGFAPREIGAMRAHLNGLGYDDERLLAAGLLVMREEREEPRPRFRDRLIFPILDQSGHTIGFGGRLLGPGEPKYLNSAESEIFAKGKTLYNLSFARNAIRREDRAIVVEGYFDVLRLVDAGVEHVVAPMGTALTEPQAELIGRYTKHVFLLYDSDGPGQKATFRAADALLAKGHEVRVVTLPEGEDPDTFTRERGREAVERLIEDAMDVFDRKVQLLQRAGWFSDLQHKRRALDRLLPTIRAASDPITRDLYLARAADAAGIAREVLLRELHAAPRRGTARTAAVTPVAAAGGPVRTASAPVPSGPYRSSVEQGNAEQTLIRVLLTQPVWQDWIFEAIGRLEAEEFPGDEAGGAEALDEDPHAALRDPVYRAIYQALQKHGADAAPEMVAEELDALAIHVYEDLRGEPDAVVDAKRSIEDAMRQLRARSLDARVRALKSLLSLAGEGEKDQINLSIKKLADEKRSLGAQHWGMVPNRK
ncbi:MAG TPA: DNA primase [Gemmatimonadaceae bacterium]|jgi:DNA primase|nr:DNA primase [Gemmatimonadaceae bacterium]